MDWDTSVDLAIVGSGGGGLLAALAAIDAGDKPLVLEKQRLASIGGSWLGICGDANHTYGYHVPAALLPSSDYSLQGAANAPVCGWHGCAIDIGMDWPVSRTWLRWLIQAIREDRITGIAEVIGSYDGSNVRYWSDGSGWGTDGQPYSGSGTTRGHTSRSIVRPRSRTTASSRAGPAPAAPDPAHPVGRSPPLRA